MSQKKEQSLLLEMVGLSDRATHRPGLLSGGEQQRVAIARSVANAPDILLADEPTGNLDPETGETVFQSLQRIVHGTDTAALIVTHNQKLAAKMDEILELENGQILWKQKMNELTAPTSAKDKGLSGGHAGFVHLRVHSAYSLSESTLRLNKLAELAAKDYQPALAITDSFNLFGAFEFSQKMMKAGIQPIIGAVVSLRDQYGTGEVVLLAQSDAGYVNLSDLISRALLATDPTQKPEILCESLAQRSTGLLLLSGGYQMGFLGKLAWNGQDKVAARRAQWLKSVFAENAYIELQRHGRAQEENAEALLLSAG